MRKKIAIVVLLCIFAAVLAGCECNHSWQEADCVTPKPAPNVDRPKENPWGTGGNVQPIQHPRNAKYVKWRKAFR